MIGAMSRKLHMQALIRIVQHLEYGHLALTLPDGRVVTAKGNQPGPEAELHLHSHDALSAIMRDGKLGFCEAFMAGEASSPNPAALIELAVLHTALLEDNLQLGPLKAIMNRMSHWFNRNTREGSRKNIAYHYDLGNEFYKSWLDQTMTYSSAIFEDGENDLARAQTAKYARLAQLADIQPGDRVLEIGCGWGGFAEYAATHCRAHVTGITISKEQFDFAQERLKNAGLEDQTDIRLMDYRDLNEEFDKIISIEMFEAVGEQYWPSYFDVLSKCLKKNGKAALQIITIDDDEFEEYRRTPDFIQKYIFPGGMLPSLRALQPTLDHAGLNLSRHHGYALDYAQTLARWRDNFLTAWPDLHLSTGFDERFKRMWELYLAYCEGGFKGGMIDVKQMLIEHRSSQ